MLQGSRQPMSFERIFLLGTAGVTALLILAIVLFSGREQRQVAQAGTVASYSTEDQERPKAEASGTFADLGNMKSSEERTSEFTIKNAGQKPLQLTKVSTSCDCTFGKLVIDGQESPEFGMHSQKEWTGTVDPGKSATLKVTYRPYIMPVKGVVTRDVFVNTNDPENTRLTFSVKAFVE